MRIQEITGRAFAEAVREISANVAAIIHILGAHGLTSDDEFLAIKTRMLAMIDQVAEAKREHGAST